jgi:hypothetical protein
MFSLQEIGNASVKVLSPVFAISSSTLSDLSTGVTPESQRSTE